MNELFGTFALIIVLEDKQQIVVAFRGSFVITNFIADIKFVPVLYPGCGEDVRLHKGFLMSTLSLYHEVK